MKIKIDKQLVKKADMAIKARIEECGDYTEKDVFLARVIWNMCFNPVELKRSELLLDKMLEGVNPSDIMPSAVKLK
jgi:hypothetical protein